VAHALFFRREQKKTQRRKKERFLSSSSFSHSQLCYGLLNFFQKREETLFSKHNAEKR
jgi:hypothetical protein